MARPDKHERTLTRAREVLRTALARGRAAEAADALLQLPSSERAATLPKVAALMRSELDHAFGRRDQATLVAWIERTEREPRLLDALGERALAARWSMFTAALRGRMWPRVEKQWTALRPALLDHALREPLDIIVGTRGAPPADALGAFTELEADATRLGYDAPRARSSYPAPSSVAEVEACCLRCFGAEPWARFREVTNGFARDASPEVASAIRVLAAELSTRELLVRSRGDGQDVTEVARFIAGAIVDASAPAQLEPLAALCLRAAARALHTQSASARALDAFAPVADAALRYEGLRAMVPAAVLGMALERVAEGPRGRLLEQAFAGDASPGTFVAIAVALHVGDYDGPKSTTLGPAWFVRAARAQLSSPGELARALVLRTDDPAADRARKNPCAEPCHALVELLPVELAADAVELLWPQADDALRERLARASEQIAARLRPQSHRAVVGGEFERVRSMLNATIPEMREIPDAELRALLRTDMGQQMLRELDAGLGASVPIPAAQVPLARQLAVRSAPYSVEMLELAISLGGERAEHRALVRAHLDRVPTLLGRFRILASPARAVDDVLDPLLEELLVEGLVPSAADAASALNAAEAADAPRRIRNQIAREVIAAVEREPSAERDPRVAYALSIARRRVRPRKPRAAKVPAKRTSKRAQRATTQARLDPGAEPEATSAGDGGSRARR